MTSPRFVVFDFDGTLADSLPFLVAQLGEVASAHGFRAVPMDELATLRGLGTREILARARLPWWKLPAVSRDYRRRMAADAGSIRLFEGVPAMLERLAAHCPVGIVTSNSQHNVEVILGEAMRFVSHGEYAASFLGKASRLRRLCRRAGIARHDTVYIGDEIRDIDAARACGMQSGAVTWGYASQAALRARGPDYVWSELDALTASLLPAPTPGA